MKATLIAAILVCACCDAARAGDVVRPPDWRDHPETGGCVICADTPAPPQQEAEPDYVVISNPDFKRVLQAIRLMTEALAIRLMTEALERQNAEITRLAGKLKETCP